MSENTRRAKALMRRVLRDRRRDTSQEASRSVLDIEKWPQKWQDKVKTARYIAAYMPIDEEEVKVLISILFKLHNIPPQH